MYSFVLLAVLAAGPMTLAQIEAEAITNNPEIASAVQQTRIAQSRLASALSLDDPQLGYRAWGMPLQQPWNLNQTQHMFMISQNVPGKGKRELKYLIAADDADIQIFLAEARKREIISMVRQAFYRLLRSHDQVRIHHDQVALAAPTIEATRIQYVSGKAAQRDVLEAGVTYSRLAEHLIMFEREADSSRAELNTLMGRPVNQPLEIEGAYGIVDTLPSQEELEAMAALNRPELLALQAMQKQGKHKMQLAQKGLSPDYSIGGGYMLMPAGAMNRNGWLAEFSMTLPWLNRGKHDAEARQAAAETDAALAEFQKQRSAIAREIRDAVIRNDAARKVVDLYRSILRPDLENVTKAATVSYQTNQAGLLSVLEAQNTSIEAEYALFDALSEYERSLADLERAIGAPVPGERRPL
jgi:outer membrane protein, heavy metal efflux system